MSANTKYVVNNVGDLSTLFLPLSSGTSTSATGYLYNAGTLLAPNYQDLNTLFAAYLSAPAAPTTSFFSSVPAHGGKDLNQVFQNIDNPLGYIINSQSNIIVTQYKNINGYNAVVFECQYPTSTVGLASITSFVALNNVTIIIVGGGGGGSYASGQGGGGGGSLTYSLTTAIPTSSTYNIQVGNGGTGGIAGTGSVIENGVNGATSFLTVIDSSSTTILDLEATGGQGGLSWVLASLYPTLGGGGVGNEITISGSGSLTLVGGGGGSGGSYTAANTTARNGGAGGSPSGSGTLHNGFNGANCTGTATNDSYSGNGGNSGLTSVSLPFFTSSTSITLGGGGGGSSNKNGSTILGSWAGAAGAGIGGKGSINKGYTGSTPYPPVSGNGTNSITTGYGGGGGAGLGGPDGSNTQVANGGSGGAGCVILYWPA